LGLGSSEKKTKWATMEGNIGKRKDTRARIVMSTFHMWKKMQEKPSKYMVMGLSLSRKRGGEGLKRSSGGGGKGGNTAATGHRGVHTVGSDRWRGQRKGPLASTKKTSHLLGTETREKKQRAERGGDKERPSAKKKRSEPQIQGPFHAPKEGKIRVRFATE